MRGCARDGELPRTGAAARHHRGARIAGSVLEAHGDARSLGRVDECFAGGLERSTWFFFVAVEDDGDVHSVERTGVFQCAKRVQQDDVAALHVDDTRSARRAVAHSLEALEWARWLEHRIEVTDEEYLWPLPRMLRNQMSRASKRRAVDPPCREAERFERHAERVADLLHSGDI